MWNLIVIQIFEMKQKILSTFSLMCLATELAQWATECSIPASSVSGLLSVLRHYNPSLPKIKRFFSRLHTQHPSN